MFLDSRSLPWMFPQILLSASPGEEIAIVSPWVFNNLGLYLPDFVTSSKNPNDLSTLIDYIITTKNIKIIFYYREDKSGLLLNLSKRYPKSIKLFQRPNTHSKGVVTNKLILAGSANLIWTSFHRNQENVSLSPNVYGSVQMAVKTAFNLM